jgi:hypothetical protein
MKPCIPITMELHNKLFEIVVIFVKVQLVARGVGTSIHHGTYLGH